MVPVRRILIALWLLALAGLAGPASAADRGLALVDVTVIDGTGAAPAPHRTLLIAGGRIRAVIPAGGRVPAGWRLIDGRGRTVIPGLWDLHVHAEWSADSGPSFFPRFVAWGVTGVRDMGGDEAGRAAAEAFARARPAWSPRVYRAGRLLDGPRPVDPSISIAVATPEQARAAVDRLADQGVDFIKVYTLLPRDAFLAAAAQARARGLTVAGHLPDGVTVEDAIAAPMASVEHMVAERGGWCPADDEAACAPIFARLAAAGVAQTPTLVTRGRRAAAAAHPEWADDPELAALPADVRDYWRGYLKEMLAASAARAAARRADYAHERRMAAGLIRAGAPILVGSDTGTPFVYPGRSLHEELQALVEAGMTPLEAISAATWRAARFVGRGERSGRVTAGYDADLVVLDADPASDIGATRRIFAVVRGGVWHDRAALDAALRDGVEK